MATTTTNQAIATSVYGLTSDQLHSAIDIIRSISPLNETSVTSRRATAVTKKPSSAYWALSSILFSSRGKAAFTAEQILELKEKYEAGHIEQTPYEYELGELEQMGDQYASTFQYLHDIVDNVLISEGFQPVNVPFEGFEVDELAIAKELKEIGELKALKERVENDQMRLEQITALMDSFKRYEALDEHFNFILVTKLLDKMESDIQYHERNKEVNAKSGATSWRAKNDIINITLLETAFKQLEKLVENDSFEIVEEGGCH